MKTQNDTGFTLIELMVSLAVVAVILTLGVPAFQDMMRNNRLTTYTNDFVMSLNYARNQAIANGGGIPINGIGGKLRVTMRKSGANWEEGWIIFLDYPTPINCDPNAPGACKYGVNDYLDVDGKNGSDEIILRQRDGLAPNYTLRANGSVLPTYVSFKPNGRTNAAGSFALCDNRDGTNTPKYNTSKLVVVHTTGRVRIAPDKDMNGIPETTDGTDLTSCLSP